MKKFIKILSIFLFCLSFLGCNSISKEDKTSNNEETINQTSSDSKSLVLYFSATGTTESVAKKIAEVIGSDIIEIIPQEEYTSSDLDYNNDDCRANKEQNDDDARPKIANTIDVEQYETIYLGYPIWWGTNPKIILTLIDIVNLTGKKVIPFCTSGGSGITQSVKELKNYNSNINWQEGKRFTSNTTLEEIKSWIDSLN